MKLLVWLNRAIVEALGHDMREFALLWLVFANLDVFVQDNLTFRWLVGNTIFSGIVWIAGVYIEKREPQKEGQ